jgi:hypothetical protein
MMASEQTNTPSPDVQTPDAAAPAPDSAEPKEGSSPAWWQRMFNRRRPGEESQPDSEDQAATESSASKTLKLTEEELQRRVQAETDRREMLRRQEEKKKQRKELRDKDPWAYAEEERKEEQLSEQNAGVGSFLANVGTTHDRYTIDPLMETLPQAERDRILKMEGAGSGLEGRKLLVRESLKALEKHWKAEGEKQAEAKLRRNAAFRKQVLAESRGSVVEPDLLPGDGGSAADQTVSALLRSHYRMG